MVFTPQETESGNWNVARTWSESMIYRNLSESREYLRLAKFGYLTLMEKRFNDEKTTTQNMIDGLAQARESLAIAIQNSLFAISSDSDKNILKRLLKELEVIESQIKSTFQVTMNRDKKTIVLNEEMHFFFIRAIERIFLDATEPMNRADLIFNYKDKFDPEKFKQDTMQRFIEGD